MLNELKEQNKKILLLENDHYLGRTLAQALFIGLGVGYEIQLCLNFEETLTKLGKTKIDLVICEFRMPRMTGLEMIEKIQNNFPDIQTILISDYGMEVFNEQLRNQVDGYLAKPFNLMKLINLVRKVLGTKKVETSIGRTLTSNDRNNNQRNSAYDYLALIDEKKEDLERTPQLEENHHHQSYFENQYGNILIMEDDPGLRRIYRKALGREKYSVSLASTIQEGRKLLQERVYDIFICDIHLGRERGTDLVAEQKELLSRNGTQVIIVSAYGQYRMMIDELGADFFLEKPISIRALVTLIQRLINNPESVHAQQFEQATFQAY